MGNSGDLPESPQKGFKITVVQGIIGAVSLAGTTAIPLLVQRALTPSPSPAPAQVQPAQVSPTTTAAQDFQTVAQPDDDNKGKGKRKGKKHD